MNRKEFPGENYFPGAEGAEYEHQRRFHVSEPSVINGLIPLHIVQAYLYSKDSHVIRVRRTLWSPSNEGPLADVVTMLTAKGPRVGADRERYDLPIPPRLALQFIRGADWVLRKERYQIRSEDNVLWDVDKFLGENDGLMIAEVRGTERVLAIDPPSWVGPEILNDLRYNNEELAKNPISGW